MIRFAFPLIVLAAGACVDRGPAAMPAPGVECTTENLSGLIGRKRSAKVEARAMRLSGANAVRWVTPGMIVTMEFRSDRLNLELGPDGRIRSTRCG